MPCGITMQTTNHQPLITNFMASFVIEGGHRLSGDIYPQGAKNEVLQIICATLLTAEEVTVHNIPGHTGRQQPYPIDAGYGSQRI